MGEGRKHRVGTHLTFRYDREADILYINTCAPYPEQESEELEDEVIVRFNPETDEIENLEVLFFFYTIITSGTLPITDFRSSTSVQSLNLN